MSACSRSKLEDGLGLWLLTATHFWHSVEPSLPPITREKLPLSFSARASERSMQVHERVVAQRERCASIKPSDCLLGWLVLIANAR